MWCDKIEFSYLGSGYVLYFYFVGLVGIILSVMGVGSIINIIANSSGEGPRDSNCPYKSSFYFKYSTINT